MGPSTVSGTWLKGFSGSAMRILLTAGTHSTVCELKPGWKHNCAGTSAYWTHRLIRVLSILRFLPGGVKSAQCSIS